MSEALMKAVETGNVNAVRLALNKAGCNVNYTDELNFTPLRLAASKGYYAIVELLLEQTGIKLNVSTENSPLMAACVGGHVDVVRLLIPRTNLLQPNDRNEPLCEVMKRRLRLAKEDKKPVVKQIADLINDATLIASIEQNFPEGVSTMLAEGANPNVQSHRGTPALALTLDLKTGHNNKTNKRELTADSKTRLEIAIKLIQAGANPNTIVQPYDRPFIIRLLEDIKSDPFKRPEYINLIQAMLDTKMLDLTVSYRPKTGENHQEVTLATESKNILFLLRQIEKDAPGPLRNLLEPAFQLQAAPVRRAPVNLPPPPTPISTPVPPSAPYPTLLPLPPVTSNSNQPRFHPVPNGSPAGVPPLSSFSTQRTTFATTPADSEITRQFFAPRAQSSGIAPRN